MPFGRLSAGVKNRMCCCMQWDLPIEEIKKIIPVRRMGQPKEVASLVAYLMSEDASYITRQVISVNGGMI